MVFGGSNSVRACSPRTAQVQRADCSGEVPKDASRGCETPGLRDEHRHEQERERDEALPVSLCISEQQLDDLEDILSEPQPSTRPRAPNPWESHEEVLLLGDRPWEELEKVCVTPVMQRMGRLLRAHCWFPGMVYPCNFGCSVFP